MHKSILLFRSASVLLILNGLAHIISLQTPYRSEDPKEMEFFQEITSYVLPSFGRTFIELNLGTSYGTALTSIIAGILSFMLTKYVDLQKLRPFIVINLVGWLVVEIFFIHYTVPIPMVLWGLVVLLYLLSFAMHLYGVRKS